MHPLNKSTYIKAKHHFFFIARLLLNEMTHHNPTLHKVAIIAPLLRIQLKAKLKW